MTPRSSLRARVVRRALLASLCAIRSVGAGGTPSADADEEVLAAYALRLRATMEQLAARTPVPRGIRTGTVAGAPIPATWVVDDAVLDTPVPARRDAHGARATDDRDVLATAARVVLHLHGGAYVLGSAATHRSLAIALSRSADALVVLPEYRLAPEHAFPAAADDALAMYRWLIERVDPARIAVSGDSAGGGLAAGLLVAARDAGLPLPACFVGMSPWTDLAATGTSMRELREIDPWLTAELVVPAARAYAGAAALDDPRVSPLYASLHDLPPVLVHVGAHEILLDDAVRFVERCREAGVDASVGVFAELWHVFHLFPIPEARAAVAEIGAFMRRHTSPDPSPGGRSARRHAAPPRRERTP